MSYDTEHYCVGTGRKEKTQKKKKNVLYVSVTSLVQ